MDTRGRTRSARLAALLLAAALVAFAGGLPAAAQEARKYDVVSTATISALDTEKRTLTGRTDEGETVRFVLDDKTEIREGADVLAFGDLAEGDRVTVNARQPFPDAEGHPPIAEVVLLVIEEAPTE